MVVECRNRNLSERNGSRNGTAKLFRTEQIRDFYDLVQNKQTTLDNFMFSKQDLGASAETETILVKYFHSLLVFACVQSIVI